MKIFKYITTVMNGLRNCGVTQFFTITTSGSNAAALVEYELNGLPMTAVIFNPTDQEGIVCFLMGFTEWKDIDGSTCDDQGALAETILTDAVKVSKIIEVDHGNDHGNMIDFPTPTLN